MTLLIVDGDNLAHRAYHSTPKSVSHNAVVGFFGMLLRQVEAHAPAAVFVGWDTLGVDTYRSKLWPAYQGGRVFDREIVEQLEMLPGLCRACSLGVGKQAGCEADDLMASAASAWPGPCLILTTDRDAYQLVSERVTVLCPRRGQPEPVPVTPINVVREFGVLPSQIPDFKALAGDSSDRIPGIKGIGPKAACSLLLKHGTLDAVVESWTENDRELALMFREVALMRRDVDVDLPGGPPDWPAGATRIRELGLDRLADRLEAAGKA